MKTFSAVVIVLASTLAGSALADDRHHPPGMSGAMPPVEQMQKNLKSMEAQLDRIAKAKTDAEREAAMAEHMQSMRAQMSMAKGQPGAMVDCPMSGGGAAMMPGAPMSGDMGPRMHQMEQRMDMMQMMMQRMMGGSGPGQMQMPSK